MRTLKLDLANFPNNAEPITIEFERGKPMRDPVREEKDAQAIFDTLAESLPLGTMAALRDKIVEKLPPHLKR